MALDWGDIPFFLAASRTLSLTKAADDLGVAQPTMTRRIAAIEAELATILFERSPAGLELTMAGQMLLAEARHIETAMQNFEGSARQVSAAGDRPVRIGCRDPEWLMPALMRLRIENPDIAVDIQANYEIANLFRRELDIVIRRERPTEIGLRARKVTSLNYGLHAATSYISHRGMPTSETLSNFEIIECRSYFDEGDTSAWRRVVDQHPRVVFRTDRITVFLEAVMSGLGIGLLVVGAVNRHPSLVRIMPELIWPTKDLHICCHEDTAQRPIIRRTLDCLARTLSGAAAARGVRAGPPSRASHGTGTLQGVLRGIHTRGEPRADGSARIAKCATGRVEEDRARA